MNREQIKKLIYESLEDTCCIETNNIEESAVIQDVLAIDSLDMIDLEGSIEDKLNVGMNFTDIVAPITFGKLLDYIEGEL